MKDSDSDVMFQKAAVLWALPLGMQSILEEVLLWGLLLERCNVFCIDLKLYAYTFKPTMSPQELDKF